MSSDHIHFLANYQKYYGNTGIMLFKERALETVLTELGMAMRIFFISNDVGNMGNTGSIQCPSLIDWDGDGEVTFVNHSNRLKKRLLEFLELMFLELNLVINPCHTFPSLKAERLAGETVDSVIPCASHLQSSGCRFGSC